MTKIICTDNRYKHYNFTTFAQLTQNNFMFMYIASNYLLLLLLICKVSACHLF